MARGSKTKFGIQEEKFQANLESVIVQPIQNPIAPTSLGAGEQRKISIPKNTIGSLKELVVVSPNVETDAVTITANFLNTGSAFTINATISGGGHVFDINPTITGTGDVFDIQGDLGGNARVFNISTTNTSQLMVASVGTVVGDVFALTANSMTSGNFFDLRSTAVMTGAVYKATVNSLTTGNIFEAGASSMTSGYVVSATNLDGLTGGGFLEFTSNSADTSLRNLVNIKNDNAAAVNAWCMRIQQDSTAFGIVLLCQTRGINISAAGAATALTSPLVVSGNSLVSAGSLGYFISDSSDANTRSLVHIINDNTAAIATTLLNLRQDAVVSTNFKPIKIEAGVTTWVSDGTTPNGNLSGAAGDICLNGASSQPFYCTGTTNWTGM